MNPIALLKMLAQNTILSMAKPVLLKLLKDPNSEAAIAGWANKQLHKLIVTADIPFVAGLEEEAVRASVEAIAQSFILTAVDRGFVALQALIEGDNVKFAVAIADMDATKK